MHIIHNTYTYTHMRLFFLAEEAEQFSEAWKKKAIRDSSCKTWQTFNSSLYLRLAKCSRKAAEQAWRTTGKLWWDSVLAYLSIWFLDYVCGRVICTLNAPTLINKSVPFKSDQTSAGKKKCHNLERAQGRAAGAGLPTWDFPVTGALLSNLSQPFIPSLNNVTLCQFSSLILFSLVMTATPVPQLNLGAWDREGKVIILHSPNNWK